MLETIKNWLKPMRAFAISSTAAATILAAFVLAGCGEVHVTHTESRLVRSERTNGKDTVVIEQENGGEITYTLNGKKVSRDKVPAVLLKPFFDDGSDYSEVLSFPPKSK